MEAEVTQLAHEAAKESVLGNLGVNWKLFVAQLINFGVVLFVLTKWVFGPLMKALDARKAAVEKGLKDAEEASVAKARASEDYDTTVVSARREAARIIEEANAAAEALKAEMADKARSEVAGIVEEGKMRLADEKDRMIREAKLDVAGLVVASTEKVLHELMDDKKQKALVETAVKKMFS